MAAEQEALKGGGGGGGGNGGRNRGGVQRVEGKLRASVEKGDYYEAHQMYRTLFFRCVKGGRPSSSFQTLPLAHPSAGRTPLAAPLVLLGPSKPHWSRRRRGSGHAGLAKAGGEGRKDFLAYSPSHGRPWLCFVSGREG